MHVLHGPASPFLIPFSVLFLRRSWIASCSDFGANLALHLGRFGAKLVIFYDIFGWWLGIFFEARCEDDFYSISDPPDPQKNYENQKFFLRILHFLQDRSGHRFWDDFCSMFGPRIR